MVSPRSIVAASLMQLCGVSIFVSQPRDQCPLAPSVASWLFVLTLLLLLWNCELLPKRYTNIFPCIHTCVELLGTIFISELAILIGWHRYEHLVHHLSQRISPNCRWCGYLTLCLLTLLPSTMLLFTLAPTQWREFVVQLVVKLPRPEADECLLECARELSNYVKGLVCFCQLRREDRLRAIRLFQLQAERRTQREERRQSMELES
ncbi:uncharacterized protein LOC117780880 [Drosophila innubila]|uniref:uncharacterized protein LOC117780880 n=1 Tax=Drosophila innubila TaxID=198719 RepID=UPI00148CD05F|nr:uncharacterized protein LOC117780880 [Drosophila innubila]